MTRAARAAYVCLGLLIGGCDTGDRVGEPGRTEPVTEDVVAAPVPSEGWIELPRGGRPEETSLRRERGVGVAHLVVDRYGREDPDDTLVVRDRPQPASAPVALLVRDTTSTFHLFVRDSTLRGAALEFGYEDVGLPGVEPPRSDGWTPILYAVDPAGTPRTGWVRIEGREVAWLSWTERLTTIPLFSILPPDSVVFRVAPGSVERSRVQLDDDDYILYPLETDGEWLRVEVVRPSEYCAEPAGVTRDTAWVRMLDDRGRPRVWYHTRGC